MAVMAPVRRTGKRESGVGLVTGELLVGSVYAGFGVILISHVPNLTA